MAYQPAKVRPFKSHRTRLLERCARNNDNILASQQNTASGESTRSRIQQDAQNAGTLSDQLSELPLEIFTMILDFASHQKHALNAHEARSLAVSTSYMSRARHGADFSGRFIFYASDFKNGRPSLDLIRFQRPMGDTVRTLIYFGADFLSLRRALKRLLEMFPNVEEVILLNATRKQLDLSEKIFYDRRYPPFIRSFVKSYPRYTYDEVLEHYLYKDRLPFPWMKPLLTKAKVRKFAIQWTEQPPTNEYDKFYSLDDSSVTYLVAVLVNMQLAEDSISDEDLQELKKMPEYPSEEWIYNLGRVARLKLFSEEEDGEPPNLDQWHRILEHYCLEGKWQPDSEGTAVVHVPKEAHRAVLDILNEMFDLRDEL